MDPFEKVAIGDTGVEVTRLGLGGAPLGGMILADGIFEGRPRYRPEPFRRSRVANFLTASACPLAAAPRP